MAIDIGGTNVKVLASGMKEPIKIPSGPTMTPALMVKQVKDAVGGFHGQITNESIARRILAQRFNEILAP